MIEKDKVKSLEAILADVVDFCNKALMGSTEGYIIPNEDNNTCEVVLKEADSKEAYVVASLALRNLDYSVFEDKEQHFRLFTSLENSVIGYEKVVNLLTDENKYDHLNKLTDEKQKLLDDVISAKETSVLTYKENILNKEMKSKYANFIDQVLNVIKHPARSNKEGFYERLKLEVIKKYIEKANAGYEVLSDGNNALVFGKRLPKDGEDIILVSSHADIVKQITKVSSEYKPDDKLFHGTYDNLGTNAALVFLMLTSKLPDNVVFAFTADEETGRCRGADEALEFIKKHTSKDPEICISLDVTDEGFDNKLISLEGLTLPDDKHKKVRDAMMLTEGEEESFCVVRAKYKDESLFPKSYLTQTTTVFDESAHYAHEKQHTISLCLPSDGVMHGNAGLDVKESTYVGYLLSLQQFLKNYTRDHELTRKEVEEVESIRSFKDYLTKDTTATKIETQSQYFHNFSSYEWDEDYEDYKAYNASFGIDSGDDELDEFKSQIEAELYQILGEGNYKSFSDFCIDAEGFTGIDFSEDEEILKAIWNDFHGLGYEDESVEKPYDDGFEYDAGL